MSKIQFNRGLKANIPILSLGEPAFATDTNEFYIGGNSSNILINNPSSNQYSSSLYEKFVGLTAINYKKDNVPYNNATNLFSHNMELNGRCVIDYNIIGLFPIDTVNHNSVISSLRGMIVVHRNDQGTMTSAAVTALNATSGLSSATWTLPITITTDSPNNKFYVSIRQDNSPGKIVSIIFKGDITYTTATTYAQQNIILL